MSYAIALVGAGPRGTMVLKQTLARFNLDPPRVPVTIHVIDMGVPGCGRIWATETPPYLLLNTVTDGMSAYPDHQVINAAPGDEGPSFLDWLIAHRPASAIQVNGYQPRRDLGEYWADIFRRAIAPSTLPPNVEVVCHRKLAVSLRSVESGQFELGLEENDGAGNVTLTTLIADQVALSTGHDINEPNEAQRESMRFADTHRETALYSLYRYDIATMVDGVKPTHTVAIEAMNLTAMDLVRAMTLGRGGKIEKGPDGRKKYIPSGKEPKWMLLMSRTGLTGETRGVNQKSVDFGYTPVFFTPAEMEAAQVRSEERGHGGKLDFRKDILVLLLLEMEYVFYTTLLREKGSSDAQVSVFGAMFVACVDEDARRKLLLETFESNEILDWGRIGRPLGNRVFQSNDEYQDFVRGWLRKDIQEAMKGNLKGPAKAMVDCLRDLRNDLRNLILVPGFTPASHNEFMRHFDPLNSRISVGPALPVMEDFVAIVEAGLIKFAGPNPSVEMDEKEGLFIIASRRVGATDANPNGEPWRCNAFLEGHHSRADLKRTTNRLLRSMRENGLARQWRNTLPNRHRDSYIPARTVRGREFVSSPGWSSEEAWSSEIDLSTVSLDRPPESARKPAGYHRHATVPPASLAVPLPSPAESAERNSERDHFTTHGYVPGCMEIDLDFRVIDSRSLVVRGLYSYGVAHEGLHWQTNVQPRWNTGSGVATSSSTQKHAAQIASQLVEIANLDAIAREHDRKRTM
jgi:hypothetical protein